MIFLCLWQSAFNISDAAMGVLLRFLVTFLIALVEKYTLAVATVWATAIPLSIYRLRKYVMSSKPNAFIEYTVSPSCHSLYKMEECLSTNGPQSCSYVKFPNHPQARYRKACGSPLLKRYIFQMQESNTDPDLCMRINLLRVPYSDFSITLDLQTS